MRARDIMSTPVVSVPPTFPVTDAANLLSQRGFTALPVIDDDAQLIGIVTEADLIRRQVAPDPRIHGFAVTAPEVRRCPTVADVMTTSVESFTPGADVADIADTMITERIRSLPIVDGRRLVGVVSRRDVLQAAVSRTDDQIQRDVVRQLAALGNPERWQVAVQGGVADIQDYQNSPADRERARTLAENVAGVVAAAVRHETCDPF